MYKKRLNKQEIQKIIELTKKGKSLNQIAKTIRKGKTTVYYHFRKIKGKLLNDIKIRNDGGLLGEFLGIVAGDGCLNKTKEYHYRIFLYFNIAEQKYVKELKEVLYKLFNKYPMQFRRENRIILAYYSKKIYDLVKESLIWDFNKRKSHSVRLKNEKYSNRFKIGFLRGSIDSDGYLSNKVINFATSSPHLAKNIKNFLCDLDFKFNYSVYKEKKT